MAYDLSGKLDTTYSSFETNSQAPTSNLVLTAHFHSSIYFAREDTRRSGSRCAYYVQMGYPLAGTKCYRDVLPENEFLFNIRVK